MESKWIKLFNTSIVRDVLAILIVIVAFEYALSIADQILNSHHS